jgi:hypothetical protein
MLDETVLVANVHPAMKFLPTVDILKGTLGKADPK